MLQNVNITLFVESSISFYYKLEEKFYFYYILTVHISFNVAHFSHLLIKFTKHLFHLPFILSFSHLIHISIEMCFKPNFTHFPLKLISEFLETHNVCISLIVILLDVMTQKQCHTTTIATNILNVLQDNQYSWSVTDLVIMKSSNVCEFLFTNRADKLHMHSQILVINFVLLSLYYQQFYFNKEKKSGHM